MTSDESHTVEMRAAAEGEVDPEAVVDELDSIDEDAPLADDTANEEPDE